jgi:hypothetical protein
MSLGTFHVLALTGIDHDSSPAQPSRSADTAGQHFLHMAVLSMYFTDIQMHARQWMSYRRLVCDGSGAPAFAAVQIDTGGHFLRN